MWHRRRGPGTGDDEVPSLADPDYNTLALHFYATNSHHIVTAAVHGISRASVSRAVRSFSEALSRKVADYVHHDIENSQQIQRMFYAISGFPNVVGAIDCTHVKIKAPRMDEGDYVNRKGYHSINVQMICDPTFRIIDAVIMWPGSVHDSRIFRESRIAGRFERGEIEGILLGDPGYPCKKYLLTPYLAPNSPAKERYNTSLVKTRVIIEHAFGVLKRRFPCLKYGLRMFPERCLPVITACTILHNIGIDRNDIYPRHSDGTQDPPDDMYMMALGLVLTTEIVLSILSLDKEIICWYTVRYKVLFSPVKEINNISRVRSVCEICVCEICKLSPLPMKIKHYISPHTNE